MKYLICLAVLLSSAAGAASAQSNAQEVFPQVAVDTGPEAVAAWGQRFNVSVRQCWNIDPDSEAGQTSVTIGFLLGADGRIVGDVTMITSSPASIDAVQDAFKAAQRAVLLCQNEGYERPPNLLKDGQYIELTFDPLNTGGN